MTELARSWRPDLWAAAADTYVELGADRIAAVDPHGFGVVSQVSTPPGALTAAAGTMLTPAASTDVSRRAHHAPALAHAPSPAVSGHRIGSWHTPVSNGRAAAQSHGRLPACRLRRR